MSPAPTVCIEQGCPNLATRGSRCDQCHRAAKRASDHRRQPAIRRGYDTAWRRTSAKFLGENPVCERCGEPAKHAHHRDGLGPNGPRGHDPANLEALCLSCHSRVTAGHAPGGWWKQARENGEGGGGTG